MLAALARRAAWCVCARRALSAKFLSVAYCGSARYLEKRDPDDVPLAALALKLAVPIWSNDDDFNVLPVEVYTTARLLKLLGV